MFCDRTGVQSTHIADITENLHLIKSFINHSHSFKTKLLFCRHKLVCQEEQRKTRILLSKHIKINIFAREIEKGTKETIELNNKNCSMV